MEAYSFLMQAFVKSHGADGSEQFRQRIAGILQRRIFKGREFPEGNGIEFSKLESLLERALRLASRSRYSTVASVVQNAAFWILKIINSKNCTEEQLASVVDKFRSILNDYDRKKSRLKLGFVKEIVRRYPWIGQELFGFVLEKVEGTRAQYRRNQLLELVDCILKSWVGDASEVLTNHLAQLCELIQDVLSTTHENKSRRKEVRSFCAGILQTVLKLNLKEQFKNALSPGTYSLCESKLGPAFAPFKNDSK
jgi:DNA polymerase phi